MRGNPGGALCRGLVLAAAVLVAGPTKSATPLKNLSDDQVVQNIRYCRGEYLVTMASGERHRYAEFNLRFKTDGSRNGPEPGRPALLLAGMQGDRAQVIFGAPEDLKRFLVEECEGAAR